MDENGPPRQGYAYKGEAPWSAPPVKYSDPTVFYATSSDNAAPQIRQFARTINLGFSIGEDKRSDIKFLFSSNVLWPLLNRPMEIFALALLMAALSPIQSTSPTKRKE
jgi:hypothetical protein